jgi:hypothetical protein
MLISHAGPLSFSGVEDITGMAGLQGRAGLEGDGCQETPILASRLDKIAWVCPHTYALPYTRRREPGAVGPGPVMTGRVAQGTPWRRGAKRTRARG